MDQKNDSPLREVFEMWTSSAAQEEKLTQSLAKVSKTRQSKMIFQLTHDVLTSVLNYLGYLAQIVEETSRQ